MPTTVDHERCFGELLRLEREQRGITLDHISASTKVTIRILQALEAEKFDQLPGGILSKGIVRGYVRCLGLDETEWIRRYLEAHHDPIPSSENDWASFALNISHTRAISEHRSHMRWTGVGVFLLLLASFGWFVWGYLHARTASAQTSPAKISNISFPNSASPSSAVEPSRAHLRPLAATYRHTSAHLRR